MAFNNGSVRRVLDPELQAQLEEAKSMSAAFTKAGGKSRPGSARRSAVGSIGGRASFQPPPIRPTAGNKIVPNTGRLGLLSSGARANNTTINPPSFKNASPPKLLGSGGYYGSNASSGAADTKMGSYSVRPVTCRTTAVADSIPSIMPTKVPSHRVNPTTPSSGSGFSDGLSNLSINTQQPPANFGSTAAPNFSNDPNSSTTSFHASTTMSHHSVPVVVSGVGSGLNGHGSASPTVVPAPVVSEALGATNDDRELIVTNWTEDEEGKPFIPAHLQQTSAIQAIQDIATMIQKPVEELTADGVSIPRPREGARPLVVFPTTEPAPKQPSVDPSGWFMAATHSTAIIPVADTPSHTAGQKVGFGHSRTSSYGTMEMDIDTVDGLAASDTACGGANSWSAPIPHIPQVSPTPQPPLATKRPSDLSGSIWSDSAWKLASNQSKKGNVRPVGNGSRSRSRGASSTGFGGNFGQGAGSSTTPSFGRGSGKTTLNQHAGSQVDQSSSGPTLKRGKKTGTLADSIWA